MVVCVSLTSGSGCGDSVDGGEGGGDGGRKQGEDMYSTCSETANAPPPPHPGGVSHAVADCVLYVRSTTECCAGDVCVWYTHLHTLLM